MQSLKRICLVHYHEIGLKGKNRSDFEMRLRNNLTFLLRDYPVSDVHTISGRLCVSFKPEISFEEAWSASCFVARIPGVARVSCGFICDKDIDDIKRTAISVATEADDFKSFRVTARRSHTDFGVCSMDMNRTVGDAVSEAFPSVGVSMKDFDLEIGIEVVQGHAYVFGKSIPGIGGLPVGSAGKVICLLSSGIDSPVALWRMARRGAVCIGVHFSGRPKTGDASEYLVDDIAHVLEQTGCVFRVYVVPMGEYQHQIALLAPPSLRIVLYRRLMYKVAQAIAKKEHCKALVTGESLGQVASQTLDNIFATDDAVKLPVFRPLIGTDKLEIINLAQQLGTYEISSQPAPDCCTLYMPKSPETHAKMAQVYEAESLYPVDRWVDELVSLAEVHDYQSPQRAKH
ncbi:MAG: tRNA 4-thiouridine(8) synthase ThiI [Eggerthellaceae bacterium]|nr:tRNA 4-thiouridine(8) synthase ThiI [Eggerthellaceae bacterium]